MTDSFNWEELGLKVTSSDVDMTSTQSESVYRNMWMSTSSSPVMDIKRMKEAMLNNGGHQPNIMVVSSGVYRRMWYLQDTTKMQRAWPRMILFPRVEAMERKWARAKRWLRMKHYEWKTRNDDDGWY